MKNNNFSTNLKMNSTLSESELFQLYLFATENDPKPQHISKSLYLTCLSIAILEQIGNKMPMQAEIDFIESSLKRFSRRKSVKIHFKNAVLASNIIMTSKAA